MSSSAFYLKVQQVEQTCLFELSWGRGQHLSTKLSYPQTLTKLYQEWQRVYLSFYNNELRGRVIAAGSFAETPVNWHAKLVQAETHLLHEFHNWLRQGELYEIRATLAKRESKEKRESGGSSLATELFLTCEPLDLARFPWESWEIGKEFAIDCHIRIVRTPLNIREAPTTNSNYHRKKARVLAILGDETGLNFQGDKEAVKSLSSVAEIEFIGWKSGQNTDELKTKIVKAIASSPGWDILFFAGHSNETNLTGGEIAIAPNATLYFNEIARSLTIAKEKGLKFAIFNSCNGLSLANALIDLGLSQVAVMREPIHNQVAQVFLVRFLQHLVEFKDVGEALLETSQYFKQEELSFKYPSAYLIPSLFRHPDAPLFRLQPWGIKQELKRWIPNQKEAIALASLALLSWQLSIQGFLLERRVLIQAIYRQITHQVPPKTTPPMLLVQIDDQSIIEAKIKDPTPMNRRYLAKLIDKASALNAKVIGIDYLLDRPHGESDIGLAESLKKSVQKQQSWFVFAATRNDAGKWVSALPEIASLNWSLQGDMNLFYSHERLMYMKLVPLKDDSSRNLPFSYLLALAYLANCEEKPNPPTPFPAREGGEINYCNFLSSTPFFTKEGRVINRNLTPLSSQERGWGRGQIPQPQLRSPTDLLSQIIEYFTINKQDYRTLFNEKSRLSPVTNFAYGLGNMWLHPIIDFSIPPDRVSQQIPAWEFLKLPNNSPQFKYINRQIVTIAPGAYGDDPGVSIGKEDVFSLPLAVSYWRKQQNVSTSQRFLTGGEGHGYMLYSFLRQRLVVPIPDLWMIGLVAVLAKGLVQRQLFRQRKGIILLLIGIAVYGLISLQVYISAAIVLPFVFPIMTVFIYILFMLRRKK